MRPQIVIGVIMLLTVLYAGSKVMDDSANKKAKVSQVPKIYVTKVSEDNYKVNCTEYDTYYKAGDYLNIPSICFENYGITDAMIEAVIKSQEKIVNPCNN
jgi:hypothetical protein